MVKETIYYYNKNKTYYYFLLLDDSKAVHRVKYNQLFKTT